MALTKTDKRNMVKLQNVIFESDEHTLMVTPKFLMDCTKVFIVKHLRAINTCMSNIKITKIPALYFSSIPPMIEHLDILIKVEPYYEMAKPSPTAFKKDFEENKAVYTANMIKRYVHECKQQVPAPGTMDNPLVRKYYQEKFDELMSFSTEMTEEDKNLTDVFYSALFKRNYKDPIPANEYDSSGSELYSGEAPSDEDLAETTDIHSADMPGA
jgi:hypothetical protein